MIMIKYEDMVRGLCKRADRIAESMTTDAAHQMHMVLGIASEAGELVDAVKKRVIYQQPLDVDNVVEELGDLEFYMEGLRQSIGYSREGILAHNIEKLTKRYGEKYSDQAAKERKDKQ